MVTSEVSVHNVRYWVWVIALGWPLISLSKKLLISLYCSSRHPIMMWLQLSLCFLTRQLLDYPFLHQALASWTHQMEDSKTKISTGFQYWSYTLSLKKKKKKENSVYFMAVVLIPHAIHLLYCFIELNMFKKIMWTKMTFSNDNISTTSNCWVDFIKRKKKKKVLSD